jgi:hypothetical protein
MATAGLERSSREIQRIVGATVSSERREELLELTPLTTHQERDRQEARSARPQGITHFHDGFAVLTRAGTETVESVTRSMK